MFLKIHLLESHLDFSSERGEPISDEHGDGESLHQEIPFMEKLSRKMDRKNYSTGMRKAPELN